MAGTREPDDGDDCTFIGCTLGTDRKLLVIFAGVPEIADDSTSPECEVVRTQPPD